MLIGFSAAIREIKKFSRQTQEIILMVQSSTEEVSRRLETLAEDSRQHREESEAQYARTSETLEQVNTAVVAHAKEMEEQRKGMIIQV